MNDTFFFNYGYGVQGEDVETFSEDMFEFGEARIVGTDKEAGVGVVSGLGEPSCMGLKSMANLLVIREEG